MKKQFIVLVAAALIILSNIMFAQNLPTSGVIGKLYTKAQADQQFGAVVQSISIKTSTLQALLVKSPKYVMFNIINGQLVISTPKRSVLSGQMTALSASQKMGVISTSIINQLIQQGGSSTTTIELRNNTLTMSNNNDTGTIGTWCPPFCP